MRILIATLVVTLAGCTGSPLEIAMASPEELQQMDARLLCNAVARGLGAEQAKIELSRRGALTDEEWRLVMDRRIAVGMSETAMICAWGLPSSYGNINRTSTQYGTRTQWVYRACQTCRADYVYTEGGKVVAVQS